MGCYNDSVVEIYSEKYSEWTVLNDHKTFPVRECDWDFVGAKTSDRPFNYQSYAISSFIAGIRNYYLINPIARSRGLPEDHKSIEAMEGFGVPVMVSRYKYEICEDRSNTWVLLSELLDFDYNEKFEDRSNYSQGINDSVEKGCGILISYREHLGEFYFIELESLKKLGNPKHVRIVFAFG